MARRQQGSKARRSPHNALKLILQKRFAYHGKAVTVRLSPRFDPVIVSECSQSNAKLFEILYFD